MGHYFYDLLLKTKPRVRTDTTGSERW